MWHYLQRRKDIFTVSELKQEGRESPCLTWAGNVSIRPLRVFTVLCMCKWSGVMAPWSLLCWLMSVISSTMGQKLEEVCYPSIQKTVIKHLCYIRQLYVNCKYVAVKKITMVCCLWGVTTYSDSSITVFKQLMGFVHTCMDLLRFL